MAAPAQPSAKTRHVATVHPALLLSQDPYIYHYTFGVEYNVDGTPVVGGKGAWSAGGFPGLTSRRIPPHLPGGSQGSGSGRSYRSQSTS